MADVFICYAPEDRPWVHALADVLVGAGMDVLWDLAPGFGQAIQRDIEAEIATAKAIVAIWSSASRNSNWVKDIAQEAIDRGTFVPVLKDVDRPPLGFRQVRSADLRGWDGQPAGLAELIDQLQGRVSGQGPSVASMPDAEVDFERSTIILRSQADELSGPAAPSRSVARLPTFGGPSGGSMLKSQPVAAAPKRGVADMRAGDEVGQYRIVRRLGAGGFGAVYEAANIHNEDERVALKLLLADVAASERFAQLLKLEANALLRLKHPAVVQYRVFGRIADTEQFYLVTEFVPGPTLRDWRRANTPGLAEVKQLASRLSQGLAAAHRRGIVHRDLAPDNVIVANDDLTEATLIDFGIARTGDKDALGGAFAGKFSYAAPEQFEFDNLRLGPSIDIYSFGLLIVAFIRGKPLDMGRDIEVAKAKRRQVPELEGVPRNLHGVLTSLLQPDPTARPRSMDEVARLFEAIEELPPEVPHEPTAIYVAPPAPEPEPEPAIEVAPAAADHQATQVITPVDEPPAEIAEPEPVADEVVPAAEADVWEVVQDDAPAVDMSQASAQPMPSEPAAELEHPAEPEIEAHPVSEPPGVPDEAPGDEPAETPVPVEEPEAEPVEPPAPPEPEPTPIEEPPSPPEEAPPAEEPPPQEVEPSWPKASIAALDGPPPLVERPETKVPPPAEKTKDRKPAVRRAARVSRMGDEGRSPIMAIAAGIGVMLIGGALAFVFWPKGTEPPGPVIAERPAESDVAPVEPPVTPPNTPPVAPPVEPEKQPVEEPPVTLPTEPEKPPVEETPSVKEEPIPGGDEIGQPPVTPPDIPPVTPPGPAGPVPPTGPADGQPPSMPDQGQPPPAPDGVGPNEGQQPPGEPPEPRPKPDVPPDAPVETLPETPLETPPDAPPATPPETPPEQPVEQPRASGKIEPAKGAKAQKQTGKAYGTENKDARIVYVARRATQFRVTSGAANDQLVFEKALAKGDSYRLPDRRDIAVSAGDAGALDVMLDGKFIGRAGPDGALLENVAVTPTAYGGPDKVAVAEPPVTEPSKPEPPKPDGGTAGGLDDPANAQAALGWVNAIRKAAGASELKVHPALNRIALGLAFNNAKVKGYPAVNVLQMLIEAGYGNASAQQIHGRNKTLKGMFTYWNGQAGTYAQLNDPKGVAMGFAGAKADDGSIYWTLIIAHKPR